EGLGALDDPAVARLLLNPFALCDLQDLLAVRLPDAWLGLMGQVGRELMDRHGLEVSRPAKQVRPARGRHTPGRMRGGQRAPPRGQAGVVPVGGEGWQLLFADEAALALAGRLAGHLYGDPGRAFRLALFRLPAGGAVLEVTPSPTANDLTLTIVFPTGDERN